MLFLGIQRVKVLKIANDLKYQASRKPSGPNGAGLGPSLVYTKG